MLFLLQSPSRLQQHILTYLHPPCIPITTLVHLHEDDTPSPWVGALEQDPQYYHSTYTQTKKSHRNLQVSRQKAWLPHQEPDSGLTLCKQQPLGQALQAHQYQALTEPNLVAELCIFIIVITYKSGAVFVNTGTPGSRGGQVHLMLMAEKTWQISQYSRDLFTPASHHFTLVCLLSIWAKLGRLLSRS